MLYLSCLNVSVMVGFGFLHVHRSVTMVLVHPVMVLRALCCVIWSFYLFVFDMIGDQAREAYIYLLHNGIDTFSKSCPLCGTPGSETCFPIDSHYIFGDTFVQKKCPP